MLPVIKLSSLQPNLNYSASGREWRIVMSESVCQSVYLYAPISVVCKLLDLGHAVLGHAELGQFL